MSRPSSRAVLHFLTALGVVAMPAPARAQWPVTRLKNVQVLPADISFGALVNTMKAFTRALGVRCTYCHVGSEAIL